MTLTTIEASDSLTFLAFEGSLDLDGSQEIEAPFLDLVGDGQKSVIVDFSKVDFLASFGMRLLIAAYKILDKDNHRLVLLNPQPSVAKVFQAAGLTSLIATASNESEAKALARWKKNRHPEGRRQAKTQNPR
jgi:anti-anti-sigma factor